MRNQKGLLIILLLIALVQVPTILAQESGPEPQHTDPNWQASYWNNVSLVGAPVLQRSEPAINYNWGVESPAPGIVNTNQFSVRWTRYIDEPAGTYRFAAASDDGIRVWVDGELIINDWADHLVHTRTADKALSAGHHLVVVEYYENGDQAIVSMSWLAAPLVITNWRGEYFNNATLSGAPVLVRDDAQLNFNWAAGSPATGVVGNDYFSVHWTRSLNLPAGNYRFSATADDGVRLWVNNHMLVDAWLVQSARTYTGDLYLPGGDVPVMMEYFENGGLAVAQLSWALATSPPPPTPPTPVPGGTVIVDNNDAGFVKGGTSTSWRTANAGYNGSLLWTYNNNQPRSGYNWARWYPTLTAGRYEVFVYVPSNYANTVQARYWIGHFDGFTLKLVDQSAYSDQWVSLGTYRFQATGNYVSLSDISYEPYLSRMIAFDAVKWEAR